MNELEVKVNGETYVKKSSLATRTPVNGERLVVGIIDNRGLTLVGYTDFKKDQNGMILIRDAQCVIRWWTGAHIGYLINGVCEGVELGAKHDAYVKEFYYSFDLPFKTIEEWKGAKISKGVKEVL